MKGKLLVVPVLLWLGAAPDLWACGNKFLVPSRGTRFGRAPVERNAKILIYAPPSSVLTKALGNLQVAAVLADAGYQPTTVSGPDELDAALRQGGWALVMADLAESTALRGRLTGKDPPGLLPVLAEPTKSQLAEAKQAYGQVIKTPAKSQQFLETVDSAVAARGGHPATAAP